MRQFLTKNKIYFETIATICLTIMAFIVSIKSWEISKRQLEIQEKTYKPIFRYEYYADQYLAKFDDYYPEKTHNGQTLQIYNDGPKIIDFQADVVEIVTVRNKRTNKIIDIGNHYGYWPSQLRKPENYNGQGLLGTFDGKQINSKGYKSTIDRLDSFFFLLDLGEIDIFKLSYKTTLGETKTEYYTRNWGDDYILNKSKPEDLYTKYKNASIDDKSIDHVPDKVIKFWKENSK